MSRVETAGHGGQVDLHRRRQTERPRVRAYVPLAEKGEPGGVAPLDGWCQSALGGAAGGGAPSPQSRRGSAVRQNGAGSLLGSADPSALSSRRAASASELA